MIAGSYRRRKETVGDIDYWSGGDTRHASTVMQGFARFGEVARIVASGKHAR